MHLLRLEGHHRREPEQLGEDYHVFILTGTNLECLAEWLRSWNGELGSLTIGIGTGTLRFQTTPVGYSSAELIADDAVCLQLDPNDLSNLVRRLEAMVRAAPDPDGLVHAHLDTYFSLPPTGLSDIVFERLENPLP